MTDRADNLAGDLVEREHTIQDAHFSATSWHSVNCARSLVLSDRVSALARDCFHALRSIATHAGKNHAHRVRAANF